MIAVSILLTLVHFRCTIGSMTEEVAAEFLTRLWELQEQEHLSSYRLAEEIGCTPGYVYRLKKGKRGKRLSVDFVLRAVRRFPELAFFLDSERD